MINFQAARSASSIHPSTPTTPDSNRRTLKWYSSIDRIFHPTDHFIEPDSRERFYLDLYLLKPDKQDLRIKLEAIQVPDLLGIHKQNINDLIGYAIKCLKNPISLEASQPPPPSSTSSRSSPIRSAQHLDRSADDPSDHHDEIDQIRLLNALETLSVVLKTILNKEGFENVNLDLITLTAGSIANSDPIFSDFVESIDMILSDRTQSLKTRHRTLQLALSVVSGVNQGSINAYFLRRDLFNTIASLIASPETVSLIFDSVLLLDLLANFRRFESRNPYLVRMEDYVDEKAMERIISLTILALEDLRVYAYC